MFEGLGLGSRLAFLQLPQGYGWVPFAGALAYSAMSPIGMAIGLGVREGLVSYLFFVGASREKKKKKSGKLI